MLNNRRFLSTLLVLCALLYSPALESMALFNKALDFVEKKAKETVKEPLMLKDLPFFDTVAGKLPREFKSFLESFKLEISNIEITTSNFVLTGSASVKGGEVIVDIRMDKAAEPNISFTLAIPKGWKFSEAFPQLKNFDQLAIHNLYIILSTYDHEFELKYKDKDGKEVTKNIQVVRGATFNGDIEITDAIKTVKTFLERITKIECFVTEDYRMQFAGQVRLGADITASHFYIKMPYKFGIDFTKKPISFKDPYLRRFYSAGIEAGIDLEMNIRFTTGFFLELKNPKKPSSPQVLQFSGQLEADPKGGVTIAGWMDGMYEPAFGLDWLGLGPKIGLAAGLMVEPPYLKEFALTAGLSLGELYKKAQATVDLDLTNANLLIEVLVDKINLAEYIKLLITVGTAITPNNKKNLEAFSKKIPTIEFTDMKFRIVPIGMQVFGKVYTAGIAAGGHVRLGKLGGGVNVDVDFEPPKLHALGVLDKFEIKLSKGPIIYKLDGPGPDRKYGTKDDGPTLEIDIRPDVLPTQQQIALLGKVSIPPLKLEEQLKMVLEEGKFVAEVDAMLEEIFSGKLKIKFDPNNPDDFIVDMNLDQKFEEFLRTKVKTEVANFEKNAKKEFDKAQAEVNKLDEKMDALRKKLETEFNKLEKGASEQVKDYRSKIANIEKEMKKWQQKCKGIKRIAYPFNECGRQLIKLEAEKTALQIAAGLTDVGKKALAGVTKTVQQIDDALKLDEKAQAIATAALKVANVGVTAAKKLTDALEQGLENFNIKSGRFMTSGKDLKAGKLPKVNLTINVLGLTVELKNIQFDIKKPGDFFKKVTTQIWDSFVK